jgi:23S rRNA-/tRNA-specific pseudouridylate synthase
LHIFVIQGILILARTPSAARRLAKLFRSHATAAIDAFHQSETPKQIDAPKQPLASRASIRKTYTALCIGAKPQKVHGILSDFLAKIRLKLPGNIIHERMAHVADQSSSIPSEPKATGAPEWLSKPKAAVTHFRLLESVKSEAHLIELEPLTGVKHQLRVHTTDLLNAPILGDYKHWRDWSMRARTNLTAQQLLEANQRPSLHLHASLVEFKHPITGELVQVEAPLPKEFRESLKIAGFASKWWAGSVEQMEEIGDVKTLNQRGWKRKMGERDEWLRKKQRRAERRSATGVVGQGKKTIRQRRSNENGRFVME